MIYNYFQLRQIPQVNPYIMTIESRIDELEKDKLKIMNDMKTNGRVGIHRKYLESLRTIDKAIETNKELLKGLKK